MPIGTIMDEPRPNVCGMQALKIRDLSGTVSISLAALL